MTDLGRQIADLMESIDAESVEERYEVFIRALGEKFPQATHADVLRAKSAIGESSRRRRGNT